MPKVTEKPILGLKSNKNFIVTNAVENILSVPKAQKQEMDWTKKSDFGRVPDYLGRIKDNIEAEYRMMRNLTQEQPEDKYFIRLFRNYLSEDQVHELREALKRKW